MSDPHRGKGDANAFFVRGLPVTKGSTRSFVVKGRAVTTSDSKKLRSWATLVATVAQDHAPRPMWTGPVYIGATFFLPRPKSEPKRRRTFPDRRPDIDKLIRAILDALTGVFYNDDGQVVGMSMWKDWAENPANPQEFRNPAGVWVFPADLSHLEHAIRQPAPIGPIFDASPLQVGLPRKEPEPRSYADIDDGDEGP